MLVAYCGLNPMGGKCKAGMPVKNIQATLDNLTSVGLSVAIYEEITDVDSDKGPSKITTKIKHRALTQIVSPGTHSLIHSFTRSLAYSFTKGRAPIRMTCVFERMILNTMKIDQQ